MSLYSLEVSDLLEYGDYGATDKEYRDLLLYKILSVAESPSASIQCTCHRLLCWFGKIGTEYLDDPHILLGKAEKEFNEIRNQSMLYINGSEDIDAIYLMLSIGYSSVAYWSNPDNMEKWEPYHASYTKKNNDENSGTTDEEKKKEEKRKRQRN